MHAPPSRIGQLAAACAVRECIHRDAAAGRVILPDIRRFALSPALRGVRPLSTSDLEGIVVARAGANLLRRNPTSGSGVDRWRERAPRSAIVAAGRLCALLLALLGCGPEPALGAGAVPLDTVPRDDAIPAAVRPAPDDALVADSGERTRTRFANVNFHIAPGVVLEIRRLTGVMASLAPGAPVVFDDKRSFVIRIATAEVALDTASLAHLMNDYVFGYAGAPLRHLSFATRGDQLVQRGVLHKVIDIPFELTARVAVTTDGLIRVHPTSMHIGPLDGMGLMKAVGAHLSTLLDTRNARGVRVDADDLLLDPVQLLPPPAIAGHVVAVRVEPGRLVQVFGEPGTPTAAVAPLAVPDTSARNYMYFSGGTLRFGKLFMVHADMQIVDLDPATPFEFSIDRYNDQLVAGYSRNHADLGIEVYMPDITRVTPGAGHAVAARPGRAPAQ